MPKPLAVLIVEDSESDAQLIVRMLTKAGYTLTFERVETAAQMRAALEKQTWEIVISDFSMPELDGYGTLKVLQETGLDIPFIVVSGTMGEETAVTMMQAGAHDYVMKGNLPRLVPAVERELSQAEVRRGRKQAEQQIIEYSKHLEEMVAERTRELRDAQEQLVLKEKLAVLGQIAGSMAHELRNPLGVILNAIYYLKLVQQEANNKITQYYGMIDQEAHNAEKIITDLLDFARSISADREPVSVPELVQRVLERHPTPPSMDVALKLSSDLPKVYADPRQMEQVLGNLVVNAYQAMSNGGKLTITAHRHKEMVAITVKDTGTGITPENMQKLFEPLFTTKAKGIGLGLAVSKKLAEANGGRIDMESEVGKGSTFTVYLPVQEDER